MTAFLDSAAYRPRLPYAGRAKKPGSENPSYTTSGDVSGHDLHEVCWQPDINATFAANAFGRNAQATPEGADFPTSVLVAGYGKTTQILRRPFRTYYSELDRLVSACDAVLFAGHGFGDVHLNQAFARFRDSRRRPVVILGYAARGTMTLSGAEPDNQVAHAMASVLQTNPGSMSWLGYRYPDVVDGLLDAREFEISADAATPLSVWYNGMLEACDDDGKFISKLV